jgi:hypothetical protein
MSGKGYATVEGYLFPLTNKQVPAFKVPAVNFVETLKANVDNAKLTDKEFREFVRKTLPIVEGGKK